MSDAPRLIACYDGPKYERLARVLASTAAEHCPGWDVRLSVVPMVPGRASKLAYWLKVIEDAPDGTRLLLMDADAMILHSLDAIWDQPFDLAYTARDPRWSAWPYNAGVIFVRASDPVRAFVRDWLAKEIPLLATTGRVRKNWLLRFGAVEQAALDQALKAPHGLTTLALPCLEWNCEDSSWAHFDPARTKIVHLKGPLRGELFGKRASVRRHPQIAPLVALWRRLERACAPAVPAPASTKVPDPGIYTPEWQASRGRFHAPAACCFDVALKVLGTPATMLDVGCGGGSAGSLVERARMKGIDAIGVDISLPVSDGPLRYADLREPLDLGRTFDLILCWEVAEHLPCEAADILCDTLVRHLAPGGTLLFTAAQPGQGGKGHINEQPPEFWRDKLTARGLRWEPDETTAMAARWVKAAGRAWWYTKNLQILHAAGSAPVRIAAPLPSLVLTMRTADRMPKPNYLGGTLQRLHAQGVDLSALHVCPTDPAIAWIEHELAGLPPVIRHVPTRRRCPNENGLAQVEAGLTAGADWVVVLEDDLAFCADFVGSLRRWLRDYDRADRHVFRCFGFTTPPKGAVAAYDWPLQKLRGSQAAMFRAEDAADFLAWGTDHLRTWTRGLTWRSAGANPLIAFDKFMAAWSLARWPNAPGVVSHPYFVNHIGNHSSIHSRGVRNDAPFAGEQWKYLGATA